LSEGKLKKCVQEVVIEDDRSKDVVVFGLAEEDSEDIDEKIEDLLGEIKEKPTFEATRIGRASDNFVTKADRSR
jgi:hypothetical protein